MLYCFGSVLLVTTMASRGTATCPEHRGRRQYRPQSLYICSRRNCSGYRGYLSSSVVWGNFRSSGHGGYSFISVFVSGVVCFILLYFAISVYYRMRLCPSDRLTRTSQSSNYPMLRQLCGSRSTKARYLTPSERLRLI
jgi:hypothetical protein